jgi:signal transduction histidine kinase
MIGVNISFEIYVLVFLAAAAVCLGVIPRAMRVEDPDTRRGLVGLLVCSGGWAAFQVLFLVGPTRQVQYAAYVVSLVVGLGTVGGWLYFCSAYTGRSFHRNPTVRRTALTGYLGVSAIKVTNHLHGFYFEVERVQEPFVHLTVQHGALHWVVAGASYALVAVGFFTLLELFSVAEYDTRPLVAAAGTTGLPVALDLVGYATPALIDINYESLGVAVFTVAVLFVFEDRFLSVQVTGEVDEAVVFLDDEGRIRDFNQHARRAFPAISGARGEPFERGLPDAARTLANGEILDVDRGDLTRHYAVDDTAFSLGQAKLGRAVVFTDVTEIERKRRELGRQNEQLEELAVAIRHELRNRPQVVSGRIAAAGQALDDGDVDRARDSFEAAGSAADGLETAVEDLSSLAEHGRSVEETDPVEFAAVVERAWERVETPDSALALVDTGTIEAEPGRLEAFFTNVFRFFAGTRGSTVEVSLRPGGFTVTDDNPPPSADDPGVLFEYAGEVAQVGSGVSLANAAMLARAHGWEASFDADQEDETRLVVDGATVKQRKPLEPTD